MFTPILIPDKNTHELRYNANPTSQKLNISRLFGRFMFGQKTSEKWEGEKQSIMSLSV